MPKQFKGLAADFVSAMKAYFIGKGANPNDIIVQDLYNYSSPNTSNSTLKQLTSLKGGNGILDEMAAMSPEDRSIIQTLLAVYNENIQTKREILTQARNLFETSDIVKIVIDVMIDDGFNGFQNEKEEFKIEYILEDDELEDLGEEFQQQVQNHIDEFVDKFALKTRVAEIIPELLRDGEYAFGVLFDENNKKGITDIIDDLDVINLIPFYENNKLAFVINQNNFQDQQKSNTFLGNFGFDEEKPIAYKPDNIVFFRLDGNTKKRINMSCFYNTEFKKLFYTKTGIRLPKYVRIALPIFYNAIGYLNRLKIMDNVASVLDLNDILKPEIVTVNVPTNTDAKEANKIVKNFERQLNDMSLLQDGELDFSTLCAQANRRKVLPVWMDTKGTVTSAGINQSAKGQGAWEATDKLRNLIALDIGVPPYYVNVSGQPMEKSQTIKLYSRYTRKLTALQKSVAEGIKDFLMIDLEHCGLNVSRANLSVKFKAITSGDTLDDTDMLVALATGLGDLYKALDEITSSDHNNLVLDDDQFKQLYDDITGKYLNVSNLIRVDEFKFNNVDGADGEFTPIGSPSPRETGGSSGPDVNVNVNTSSGGGEESYADFVDASNDIGVPGTEPAIEEI